MVLFIIGLGLSDEKDITLKGLESIQKCSKVFLEAYTSILGVNKEKLEKFYGKEILEADRECCESGID
jgi:diphthine synthase